MNRVLCLAASAGVAVVSRLLRTQSKETAANTYKPGPLHRRLAGVGEGLLTSYTHTSTNYNGHTRKYWVYKPAGFQQDVPAGFMLFSDGDQYFGQCIGTRKSGYSVLPILDNLVHTGHMPPNTIFIFAQPGIIPGEPSNIWDPFPDSYFESGRFLEYDTVDKRFGRFLLDELLPSVQSSANVTLTRNPRLRGLCGHSSGGLCALNTAFEYPEAFQKVISHCGSFAKLQNGHLLPFAVRECNASEKPIRVFLQSGTGDAKIKFGDWFLQNQVMQNALEFAGIEHTFEWGVGRHDIWHGTSVMPETLKWLWRDWRDEDPNAAT